MTNRINDKKINDDDYIIYKVLFIILLLLLLNNSRSNNKMLLYYHHHDDNKVHDEQVRSKFYTTYNLRNGYIMHRNTSSFT